LRTRVHIWGIASLDLLDLDSLLRDVLASSLSVGRGAIG
jgi:hypothetical protein